MHLGSALMLNLSMCLFQEQHGVRTHMRTHKESYCRETGLNCRSKENISFGCLTEPTKRAAETPTDCVDILSYRGNSLRGPRGKTQIQLQLF